MYSLFRMAHPPTGVEHSVEAHFFGRWERNLVVAGANVLRVFRYNFQGSDIFYVFVIYCTRFHSENVGNCR